MIGRRLALLCVLPVAAACVPEVGEPPSAVSRTRVLGVSFEPAEARPGEPFVAKALVVGPDGELDDPSIAWAACVAPKRPTDSGSVTPLCIDGPWAIPLATGATVEGEVPDYACGNLGPESPPGEYRPPDPDKTGGFYMPVRAIVEDETAFGMLRLRCKLTNVPVDVAAELNERWTPNRNVGPVEVTIVPRGPGSFEIRARVAATSAETYELYDVAEDRAVTQRERLIASFYSAGIDVTPSRVEIDPDRLEDEMLVARATATGPADLAEASVWVVVRDDRGGVAWSGGPVAPP